MEATDPVTSEKMVLVALYTEVVAMATERTGLVPELGDLNSDGKMEKLSKEGAVTECIEVSDESTVDGPGLDSVPRERDRT